MLDFYIMAVTLEGFCSVMKSVGGFTITSVFSFLSLRNLLHLSTGTHIMCSVPSEGGGRSA